MSYLTRILISFTIIGSFCIFSAAQADVENQRVSFKVNSSYDTSGRSNVSATLRFVSQYSYFYVEDAYWDNLSPFQQTSLLQAVNILASEFDQNIYPKETALWGNEARPGVDNDSRITILLQNLKSNYGGYFDSIHGYTQAQASDSNQREMVFLSIQSIGRGFEKVFLGHEFQHLISHNQKELLRNTNEIIWLNEARSEYTASLLGHNASFPGSNLERRLNLFLQNPSDSLTHWPNVTVDYAITAVFVEYLVEQYGTGILSETLKNSESGIASLNRYLAVRQYPERFSDIFANWMIAATLNNRLSDSRYGYKNPNLANIHVPPQHQFGLLGDGEQTLNINIQNWQPIWIHAPVYQSTGKAVKISISSSTTSVSIPVIIEYTDGSYEIQKHTISTNGDSVYLLDKSSKENRKQVQRIRAGITSIGPTPETSDTSTHAVTLRFSLVEEENIQQRQDQSPIPGMLHDGVLVKRFGSEPEVYVIEGKYKRYLRPEIIALYGHLVGILPLEVSDEIFHSYSTANYIRNVNQKQVYAVWPDGTKHWLSISADQFTSSGRDWGSIFIVNDSEFNSYRTGAAITR